MGYTVFDRLAVVYASADADSTNVNANGALITNNRMFSLGSQSAGTYTEKFYFDTSGNATFVGNVTFSGSGTFAAGAFTGLTYTTETTDGQVFIPAMEFFPFAASDTTLTRNGANDISYAQAASKDVTYAATIRLPYRTTASKGYKLTSMKLAYKVTGDTLTTLAATLNSVVYANNAALAITSIPITGTLTKTVQTNPYLATLTVTTPAYNAGKELVLEVNAVTPAGGTFDLYGVYALFSQVLL